MNSNYERYNKILTRSVKHIYKNLLKGREIEEVYQSMSSKHDRKICITMRGSLAGELISHLPEATLNNMTYQIVKDKNTKPHLNDVAGELANQISGTFINQLQFLNHKITLSAPWFNEDQLSIKALYDNINLSFDSELGGFDVDLYYSENV